MLFCEKCLFQVQIQFAIDICQEYLEGINFYQNYFSDFLMVLLMLMLIGWIFNLIYEIINKSEIGEGEMSH